MNSYTRVEQIEEFLNTITVNDIEISSLDIHVLFASEATKYIGKAVYSPSGHRYTIYLSRTYFKMIEVQAKEVLYHELAHIVAHYTDRTMEHNETWRKAMHDFGYAFPKHLIIPLCI